MAFRDWVVYNSGFSGSSTTDDTYDANGILTKRITTPFPGCDKWPEGDPRYFAMGHPNVSTGLLARCNMVPDGNVLGRGFTSGVFSVETNLVCSTINGVAIPSSPMNWGVACMMNTLDITNAGECYAAIMDTVNFSNVVRLIKMTNGISFSPGGSQTTTYKILGETSSNAFGNGSVGDTSLLALQWEHDPYFLKGTRLIVLFRGNILFDIVHTGPDAIINPSPVSECIFAAGQTNQGVVLFKNIASSHIVINTVNGVPYPPS